MRESEWTQANEAEFMTPENIVASNLRAQNHEQRHNPFHDFMDSYDLYPDTLERRQPTQAEKERLDMYLTDLGKLFEGSNIRWHIDGALNISLDRGRYIGVHKDIDISVDEQDLQLLDETLNSKGYGLFLSEQPDFDGEQILTRSTDSDVRRNILKHLIVARIDAEGKVVQTEHLNFLDVHLLRRNSEGKVATPEGVALPEAWCHTRTKEFKGVSLNLAHPAEVVYHKLRQGWPNVRAYDQKDLEMLVEQGSASLQDIDEIEALLRSGIAQRQVHAKNVAEMVWRDYQRGVQNDFDLSAGEIFAAICEYPLIKLRAGDAVMADTISELADQIYRIPEKSLENITAAISLVFEHNEFYKDQFTKLGILRNLIKS